MREQRKDLPDYLRVACDAIDPGQLGATTGTSVESGNLMDQAALVCVGSLAFVAPEALPVCGLVPFGDEACHFYNLAYDFVTHGGYYFDNLFLPMTPVPTSANRTSTPTITSTPTPRDSPTPMPTITLSPTPPPDGR